MNNKLYIGLGGAGKSRLPISFLKYKKNESTNHTIIFTDDMEENDDQTRESDSETL